MKITKCTGVNCTVKEICYRHTVNLRHPKYFDNIPGSGSSCPQFIEEESVHAQKGISKAQWGNADLYMKYLEEVMG